MTAKIETIKLRLGQREFELSLEEAKALYNELSLLFPQQLPPVVIQPTTYPPYIGSPFPSIPPYQTFHGLGQQQNGFLC